MKTDEAVEVLKKARWGLIEPQYHLVDMDSIFLDFWERVKDFTLISVERAYALYQSIKYLRGRDIADDFVECGVWKGGASMLAALCYQHFFDNLPQLWLYDTYQGMTQPDEKDIIAASGQPVSERDPLGWWAVSLDEVRDNLISTGYPLDKIHFIKGDVAVTLPAQIPDSIGLLRLDTDWYASTRIEMELLYPKLRTQGILLIDDYGHFEGARQAVDEMLKNFGELALLQRVDYTGRMLIKSIP